MKMLSSIGRCTFCSDYRKWLHVNRADALRYFAKSLEDNGPDLVNELELEYKEDLTKDRKFQIISYDKLSVQEFCSFAEPDPLNTLLSCREQALVEFGRDKIQAYFLTSFTHIPDHISVFLSFRR